MKPEIDINSAPDLHEAKKRGKLAKSQEDEAEIKPSPFLIEWGKGKKYFIETFGCQMNVRDSEIIRGYLAELLERQPAEPFHPCSGLDQRPHRLRGISLRF